jgi:hypothetical protein
MMKSVPKGLKATLVAVDAATAEAVPCVQSVFDSLHSPRMERGLTFPGGGSPILNA